MLTSALYTPMCEIIAICNVNNHVHLTLKLLLNVATTVT
jgi:hypothetical protein